MSRPSKRIVPASGFSKPVMRLNSVDLAGAVRADDAERFARGDLELDVVDRFERAERLRQIVQLEHHAAPSLSAGHPGPALNSLPSAIGRAGPFA